MANAINVRLPIRADFDLKLTIACGAMTVEFGNGFLGRPLGCHPIHRCAIREFAPEEHPDRLIRRLAQNVPARRIKRRFGIAVSLHRVIENLLNQAELSRIFAQQFGCHQFRKGFDAFGMRDHVVLAAGCEFPTALQPCIRVDHHDRGHRDLNRVASTPGIGPVYVGKRRFKDADTGDFHRKLRAKVRFSLSRNFRAEC